MARLITPRLVNAEWHGRERKHMDKDVIIWSHSKLELLRKMLMWACREAGFDRNIWLYIKWNIKGCGLCFGSRIQASLLELLSDFKANAERHKSWVPFFKHSISILQLFVFWVFFFPLLLALAALPKASVSSWSLTFSQFFTLLTAIHRLLLRELVSACMQIRPKLETNIQYLKAAHTYRLSLCI